MILEEQERIAGIATVDLNKEQIKQQASTASPAEYIDKKECRREQGPSCQDRGQSSSSIDVLPEDRSKSTSWLCPATRSAMIGATKPHRANVVHRRVPSCRVPSCPYFRYPARRDKVFDMFSTAESLSADGTT
jgi:hypothetical protein